MRKAPGWKKFVTLAILLMFCFMLAGPLLAQGLPKITVEFPEGRSAEEAVRLISDVAIRRIEQVKQSDLPENFKRVLCEIYGAMGYELITPIQYSRESGSKIYFVDHPDSLPSQDETENLRLEALKITEKKKKIPYDVLRAGFVKYFDRAYQNPEALDNMTLTAETERELEESMGHLLDEDFEEEREQFMANEIIRIKTDLHVGGMAHIFGGDDSFTVQPLYKRLG
ncbi:hypothetical protein IID10_18585, partial [candidate division KSB1 bacterium]|nr:hypothetical protein [candidate division KSB1 bacterium]